jgi:hypothetical protein
LDGPALSGELRESLVGDGVLSSVRLSDFGLRREPPRPPRDRRPGYEKRFDYDTLYYDVFRSGDGRHVVCAGPPLLGCEKALSALTFRLPGSGRSLEADYRPPRVIQQPTHRVHLSGAGLGEAQRLKLTLGETRVDVPIQPSGRARFSGRRAVTTLQKKNPLDWIRVHGADAFVIYDNGSSDYAPADIVERLGWLDGQADLLVVPWPFPYGPGGGRVRVNDSFFCQPGQLDHVRRRYCEGARAVLNCDIDELLVGPRGESIFERAERSGRAAILISGVWVEAVGPMRVADRALRHTDCVYRWRSQLLRQWWGRYQRYRAGNGRPHPSRRAFHHQDPFRGKLLRSKWIAVPGLCGDDLEWGVHDLFPVSEEARLATSKWKAWAADTLFRHFRQLTLNQKRGRSRVPRYSPFQHVRDRPLESALAIAFPERGKWQRSQSVLSRLRSGIEAWRTGRTA